MRLKHGSAAAFLFDAIVLAIIAATVFFICAGLAGYAMGEDSPPPRRLIVWHDPAVANSRQFFDDCSLQGLAQELLAAGWRVERIDVRQHPLQALCLNVQAAPCFVIPGRGGCYWYGYDRERFREFFDLTPRPEQSETTSAAEQFTTEQLQQLVDDQIAQQRAEIEQQLGETTEAEQARQLALEQAIAQQQQQLEEIERGNPETEQRIDRLAQILDELLHRDQASSETPAATSETITAPDETPAAGGFLSRAVQVGGYTVTVLQALGVLGATSTGVGGAVLGGLWLLGKLKARRAKRRAGEGAARAPFPRKLDEARELCRLRQREGRVGPLDQLRGMVLDDEIAKFMEGATPAESAALKSLMQRIDARVDEIAPLSTEV